MCDCECFHLTLDSLFHVLMCLNLRLNLQMTVVDDFRHQWRYSLKNTNTHIHTHTERDITHKNACYKIIVRFDEIERGKWQVIFISGEINLKNVIESHNPVYPIRRASKIASNSFPFVYVWRASLIYFPLLWKPFTEISICRLCYIVDEIWASS